MLSPGSDQEESPSELISNASEEFSKSHLRTKDEQIVNAALIDFLNAFVVHRGLSVQWTLHRKLFVGNFAEGTLTARTDGCLEEIGSEKTHALAEVKPLPREKARYTIAMQEAAQMVAWIKSEPDPEGFERSCGQ